MPCTAASHQGLIEPLGLHLCVAAVSSSLECSCWKHISLRADELCVVQIGSCGKFDFVFLRDFPLCAPRFTFTDKPTHVNLRSDSGTQQPCLFMLFKKLAL